MTVMESILYIQTKMNGHSSLELALENRCIRKKIDTFMLFFFSHLFQACLTVFF